MAYNQLALALRRSTAASQPSASTIQRVLAEAAKTPDPIDPKITTPEAPTPKPPERTTNGGNGVATVHDALAFLATQDAALKATDNIVARIGQLKEASIQAGATVGELTDLNAEYLKLRGDLESISEGTFNGVSLFSTYAGEFAFSEVSGTQFSVPSDDGSTAVQISQPNYYGTGFTLVGGYRNTPNLQSLQVVSTRAILEALALTREQNALETARLKAVQSVNGVAANAPITNEATTTTALANAKSAMIANPDAALMIQANTTAAAVLQLTRA